MAKKCTDCGVVVDSLKGSYNMWLLRNRDAEGNPIELTEQNVSVEPETDNQDTDEDKEAQSETLPTNPVQDEIDAKLKELETTTDKAKRVEIKNRIQYLKRKLK